MARKAFLLRMEADVLAQLQRWADEDLRSLNGQIEFLLRQALMRRGAKVGPAADAEDPAKEGEKKG